MKPICSICNKEVDIKEMIDGKGHMYNIRFDEQDNPVNVWTHSYCYFSK